MAQDDELTTWVSKTHQMIGRNLLLFQRLEHLLKVVLPRATVSVSPETDIPSLKDQRYAEVETCTLGTLVNRFIDEVCDPNEPSSTDDSDGLQVTATFRLRFESSEGRDAQIKRLKTLVEGRNRLVHHFLPQIEADSIESWRSTHEGLEVQHREVLSEIETLRRVAELMELSRSALKHPELRRELVLGSVREQLIEALRISAGNSTDPDGWTPLRDAIRSEPWVSSKAIPELLGSYDIRTVSAFLEASGGFEIRHEKDQKGKSRTFYRVTTPEHSPTPDSSTQER
jgi:hypothetical protein